MDEKIYEKLKSYNQLHLLKYYDELNTEEKQHLVNQISAIDFSVLDSLKSVNTPSVRGKIEPVTTLTLDEFEKNKDEFYSIGIECIRQGKAGAVLLAGGQGTRLGFDKPKGMLQVGINKSLYLFEILINNILDVVKQANAWVPLFIMTSEKNNQDTVDFFKEHNYFGYNKDYIYFFIQEMAPSVDYSGKIYMEGRDQISLSPNGNGGWFTSLMKAGYLKTIQEKGIEWLNIFSVDNVLQKIADPYFIGATLKANCTCGAKVVKKAAPDERVGVLCLEDGRPSIVEYYEMTDDMQTLRNEKGELLYNYGVTLNYLFKVTQLEQIANTPLPIHVVEKKIPYMDEQGNDINPEKPNGYKFETLVLDMIHRMDSVRSCEVDRYKEFAPIKNKTGVDSLESARELLQKNGTEL